MFTNDSTTIRLHVFLAHMGVASRRKAEAMIAEGRVTVNNKVAVIGQPVNPATDTIAVDGTVIAETETPMYILINKPVGVVSTTDDELHRRSVLDLLPTRYHSTRLYPVGRLDIDSQGLMLLTNDGDLAYKMTHPKFEIEKEYQVLLDREPSDAAIDILRRGMLLREGMTAPAEVEFIDKEEGKPWISITIHEGRNRQVRRMMERAGYDVRRLIRVKLGPFSLDDLGDLLFKELDPQMVTEAVAELLQ